MTAFIPSNVWSLPAAASRLAALRSQPLDDPRLDEAVALRRCAQYRKAFRCAAVSYPADMLRLDAPADWIRRRGVAVDVADTEGVAAALSAGVLPQRIIMHGSAISPAANAGAGRFVVNS